MPADIFMIPSFEGFTNKTKKKGFVKSVEGRGRLSKFLLCQQLNAVKIVGIQIKNCNKDYIFQMVISRLQCLEFRAPCLPFNCLGFRALDNLIIFLGSSRSGAVYLIIVLGFKAIMSDIILLSSLIIVLGFEPLCLTNCCLGFRALLTT